MLSLPSALSHHKTLFLHKPPIRFHHSTVTNPNFLPLQSSLHPPNPKQTQEEAPTASSPFPPLNSSKRVVLVRHGQSTWNEQGRIQGSSDFSVLTPKGEVQAETSRKMLVNDAFDVCFASPLARSRRTAEVIWSNREEEIVSEYELREIDLYSFQGLLKHEGKDKYGEAYLNWQKDAPNFEIDGHYPVRELWDRARNCWAKILIHEGESVLVVAHNAINQALVSTAIGLGTDYFRILVQSNCGVTVLDFIPKAQGGYPYVRLNRLNQTPYSPITAKSSDGRKSSKRIILACHGPTQRNNVDNIANSSEAPMNMLGTIQSQKTAELLLDLKVTSIICSTESASTETAMTISKVQEAADCLITDCDPRIVQVKKLKDLDVESVMRPLKKGASEVRNPPLGLLNDLDDGVKSEIWNRTGNVWKTILDNLSNESEAEQNLVVVAHPVAHIALLGHCLELRKEYMDTFQLDAGSISVIDFPDGLAGRAVTRCINYTAHLGRWSVPVTRSVREGKVVVV